MALFGSLFHLFPSGAGALEDFHTEIAAFVLGSVPDATLAWLREIGATKLASADEVIVTTQEELLALEMHASGSRPDIAIRLSKGDIREIIFVESKIGAREGNRQLERYVDHLRQRKEAAKALIYITRSYEPKEKLVRGDVEFVQTRWSAFYHFFSSLPNQSDVLRELLVFMEEHNMSQTNKFTTIDVLALSNFSRARKLMDATMWESVHKKFTSVCGGKFFWKESAFTHLRNHRRYVMAAGYGQGYQFETLLGYWVDQDVVTDSPWVGVTYHVNPKAAQRRDIVAAFEAFVKTSRSGWETFDLSDEKVWGGMYRGKNLEDFFAEEDHVNSITRHFEELLDDVAAFKRQYPKLPWRVQQLEGEPK